MENKYIVVSHKGSIFYVNANFTVSKLLMFSYMKL
jgi:hypothetical protein